MGFENRARPSPDFEALTRPHKDAVYRQMLRVCDNREDAEDVLVEALLKAYRHLDQLRDSAAFRSWLGISRAAMKSRLHRARELVRNHLDAALGRESSQ